MVRKRGKIRLFGAMPGTGKSALLEALRHDLADLDELYLGLEHEQFLTPEQRVSMAKAGNLSMDSREFVLGVNLPGQKGFQAHLRFLADNGINVVAFAPWENVYQEVPVASEPETKKPLYQVMLENDFKGYDMALSHILLVGDNAAEVMENRLRGRAGKSPWQSQLDYDKVGNPLYYSTRAAHIRKSSVTFDLPLIEYPTDKDIRWLIPKVMKLVLS